jgi:hypothetical protein
MRHSVILALIFVCLIRGSALAEPPGVTHPETWALVTFWVTWAVVTGFLVITMRVKSTETDQH